MISDLRTISGFELYAPPFFFGKTTIFKEFEKKTAKNFKIVNFPTKIKENYPPLGWRVFFVALKVAGILPYTVIIANLILART